MNELKNKNWQKEMNQIIFGFFFCCFDRSIILFIHFKIFSFFLVQNVCIMDHVVGHHHHWWNPIVRQSDNNTKVFFQQKKEKKRKTHKNTHRNKRIGDVYEIPVTKHCIV